MSRKIEAFECINCGGIWKEKANALSHKCIQRHDESFLQKVEVSPNAITR